MIQQLYTAEGKLKYLGSMNLGGVPILDPSPPMRKLIEQGNAIQPRLLSELKDPRIRNEVALILAQIGDKGALAPLIELLPSTGELTQAEGFSTMCLLYALWQLTGMELGIHHKFSPAYTPEFRKQWQSWYATNKDYLYTPSKPKLTSYGGGRDRVLVDFEAKLAARPTTAYRQEYRWIAYEEIKSWRGDPGYKQKLKNYCLSVILNLTWNPYGHAPREAIRSLGRIQDPRALAALHALCTETNGSLATHDLIWTLEDKGDVSSIPFLEKIPPAKGARMEADSIEPRRARAIERIRLLQKYADELRHKPFDGYQQLLFVKCLASSKGVDELIAILRNRDYEWAMSRYARVAGYFDQEPVRACLKEMAADRSRDDRSRAAVHGALARLGEKDSLAHLKRSLSHKRPGVRLAAAEGLWHLGNREGFKTLVELLDLRPIESGGEGVRIREGGFTVEAVDDSNVDYIRSACEILGEMGDRSAIEPLKRLLPLNLNGVLAGGGSGTGWSGRREGGSGTGWSGRPDAVALAKLGDFSGIAVLRASISKGDPLGVVGWWERTGDFVAIGLKQFIPELLPMLEHRDESKRVLAAQAILLLLESGR